MLFGATALAGSAAALPFVTEPWQLIAAYLVMSFGWATMSLGAINNILGLWFQAGAGSPSASPSTARASAAW